MRPLKRYQVLGPLIYAGLLILLPGCDKTDPPSLTTLPVTEITGHTAQSGGNVSGEGTSAVTARGVVWHSEVNPTIELNSGLTVDSTGSGEFASILKDLTPETVYYLRAYAVNDAGTAYGEQVSFSTLQGDGTNGTVTDIDGNIYNTVFIGGREWMAENLKTTRYNDGTVISYQQILDSFPDDNSSGSGGTKSSGPGTYMWYGNNEEFKESYGALYNWHATESNLGLCPAGWEIPAVEDWDRLVAYLILQYDMHNDHPSDNIRGVGNALKSCRQINSPLGSECDVAEHPRWNETAIHYGTDNFGFNGLPAGRYIPWGGFMFMGGSVIWWTSTEYSDTYARGRGLSMGTGHVTGTLKESFRKIDLHGVRCIRIAE
jgi:uncharacterized protein (TIGR02145 family)